jgi:hypothetical protein
MKITVCVRISETRVGIDFVNPEIFTPGICSKKLITGTWRKVNFQGNAVLIPGAFLSQRLPSEQSSILGFESAVST